MSEENLPRKGQWYVPTSEELETAFDLADRIPCGEKFDGGKPKFSYLPYEALVGAAKVFEFGAAKYGKHNYRAGMDWSRPWDAAQRHLSAWWNGESTDPESGRSHLDHALCNLMMLKFYEERKVGTDDRYQTK